MTAVPESAPARGGQIRALAAAIACISIVGVGLSLTIPLLSLELDRRGVSGTVIGLQTGVQALGSIATAFFVPRLLAALGARVLLSSAILLAATIVASFPAIADANLWFPLRAVLGGCLAVLFAVSEYWITGVADARRRGLVMGIYATFLSIGFATGPALLAAFGSSGWTPYLAGAAIFLTGLVPVSLGVRNVPGGEDHGSGGLSVSRIVRIAPVPVLAAFFFGAVESSAFSFLAIWGQGAGFTERDAALLLTVSFLGNVALQIPLGLLADRVPKRPLLLLCGIVGGLGPALAPFLVPLPALLVAVLFLWGGLVAGLYTVGLAHLADRFRGSELAAANSAFVLNYSLGMLVGPPLAGAGLQAAPPHGFLAVLAALAFSYAALVAVRMTRPS